MPFVPVITCDDGFNPCRARKCCAFCVKVGKTHLWHHTDDWSCAEWCRTHLLPCWHPSVWKRPHYDSVTQTWQHSHMKMLIFNLGFKNQTNGATFTDNLTKSVFSHVYNSHISQSEVTWCLPHLFFPTRTVNYLIFSGHIDGCPVYGCQDPSPHTTLVLCPCLFRVAGALTFEHLPWHRKVVMEIWLAMGCWNPTVTLSWPLELRNYIQSNVRICVSGCICHCSCAQKYKVFLDFKNTMLANLHQI